MEKVGITREMNAQGGRYVAKVEGFPGEAELTFVRTDSNVFIADHTLTPVAPAIAASPRSSLNASSPTRAARVSGSGRPVPS